MSQLIGSFGNSITQTVNGIFPEGGLGGLATYAVKAVNAVSGVSVANHIMDAQFYVQKKVWGGMPFPGTLKLYDDKIEFVPSFMVKIPIYQGIQAISIPYRDIKSAEKIKKTFLKLSAVKLTLSGGEFLIAAPFATDNILAILRKYV